MKQKLNTTLLRSLFIITCLLFMQGQARLFAQWSTNTAVNNAICTATDEQNIPRIISDGAGGAIITWYDKRNGTDYNIYAQRIDAAGVIQWTTDGVVICNEPYTQTDPHITTDGAGGAIITWIDLRNNTDYNIYAQRINAAGTVQWTANGVAICTAANSKAMPRIISDGAGGAIISWRDRRNGPPKGPLDIYAQRINAAGTTLWTTNGVAICTQAAAQDNPNLASDGLKGAIVVWNDLRNGNDDIYAQRVDSSGTTLWTTDGIVICTASAAQIFPIPLSDGSGGAIIAWDDFRNGNTDIYAQQVNAAGTVGWTANGIVVCNAANNQFTARLIPDNSGGAILTWNDNRTDPDGDIYAQHISSSGTGSWTANGEPICTESSEQRLPSIAPSGTGAIIAWYDGRNGSTDIYSQRINSSGTGQWTTDGIAICTASGGQWNTEITASTGGSAIITWPDSRGISSDIYAQRVNADGTIGACSPPSISSTATHIECGEPESGAIDITVSGGASPYTYAWTGTGVSSTAEDQSGLTAGTYSVIVTDSLNCTATDTVEIEDCSERYTFKSTVPIENEIEAGISLSVQPNPGINYFNLQIRSVDKADPVRIRVFDAYGKIVTEYQMIPVNSILRINSGKWTPGVYYAEVIQAGKRKVIKLVKGN